MTARRDAYLAAGVDIDAGDRAVELMRSAVESTNRSEVVHDIGGFGAAVAVPAGYRNPILISSTDGVGTKTAIAIELGRYDTIGIDLVAMCADDVVCSGAAPLFFLDYIAVGRLDPEAVAELVGSIAAGCREAGAALVGGETAEHPGILEPGEFDLAGFCVGVVERDRLIDGSAVQPGDAIIGLASSGLHSNGFSLVRALLSQFEVDLGRPYQEQLTRTLGAEVATRAVAAEPAHALATFGEVLLAPTTIYTPAILTLRERLIAAGHDLRAVAHVTGGGLPGNVPRVLPRDLAALLDPDRWPMPSIMQLMAALGGLEELELRATLNGGLGMVVVVAPEAVPAALAALADVGRPAWEVGRVVAADAVGGHRYAEGRLAEVTP
jgi:phosphoribosylformylglycinamidine cyclo-ligase